MVKPILLESRPNDCLQMLQANKGLYIGRINLALNPNTAIDPLFSRNSRDCETWLLGPSVPFVRLILWPCSLSRIIELYSWDVSSKRVLIENWTIT